MAKKIYQIQIALKGFKPKIWRRLLVDPDTKLDNMHRIIQTAMGWTNSHLHVFSDGDHDYAPKEFEVEDTMDSRKKKLSSILKYEKSKILYEYDFGDGWQHDIILEKILLVEAAGNIPRCTAGKRNCPPEDCGGIWGYEDLIKIISDSKHEEYESMMEWLGGDFNPEYFDILEVNYQLSQKNFGCLWIH